MRRREALLVAMAVAAILTVSITYASVFVYYPISVQLQPTPNPIYFAMGSNAGKQDISGTIGASPGPNGSSLSITIHPTYQLTYYKNLSVIVNGGSSTYYLYLRIQTPVSGLPSGSKAYLCLFQAGVQRQLNNQWPPAPTNAQLCADLTSTGLVNQGNPLQLNAGGKLEVDIYTYIPEGTQLPSSATASVQLIYTPQGSETPPT